MHCSGLRHPMKAVWALLCCFLVPTAGAQEITVEEETVAREEYATETLFNLWLDYRKDEESLARFYDALPAKHLIEVDADDPTHATVTYFAKGSDDTDYLLQSGGPDFYGLRFRRIDDSPYFFCTQDIPSDAWFTYGVNEFRRTSIPGSGGLAQTSMEHVYDGTIVGPDAPLSAHIQASEEVPKGELREITLPSRFMGEERGLVVYTPAGYDRAGATHLVVQLDGQNYSRSSDYGPAWQGWTPLPTILDNLTYRDEIAPTVAVMVLNQGRRSQDMLSEAFADFIALEVIAWAKETLNVSDSSNVIVSGPSRAAFAAANAALRHPDLIDGVLSQSGSFYYTLSDKENWPVYPEFEGKLLADFKTSPTLPVAFYLDVGLYDLGLGRVGVNRQLKDILELKGYRLSYNEYKGGHSHLNWRHTLPSGLIYFLGQP